MITLLLLHCLCIISVFSAADIKLLLDGNDWTITNPNNQIEATVPGSVYIDLLNANKIPDPYYGNNSNTVIWIANKTWTYTKQFNITNSILDKNIVQLISEGIDTKADIYLNSQLIFKNDNMFHRNFIEIKSLLKQGMNNITIKLYSKVKWALNEAASCNITTDGLCPYNCPPYPSFCDFNFIRTQQSSAGWNWAAKFASMGIWKSIYIQAYDQAVVRDWIVSASPVTTNDYNGQWNLTFTVYIDSGQTNCNSNDKEIINAINGQIRTQIPEFNVNKLVTMSLNQYEEKNITFSIITPEKCKLWFPNGYNNGKPAMYGVKINFIDNNGNTDQGIERSIGLRVVELMQPIAPGGYGKLFYFKINGITVPVHGSNWVPSDAFQGSLQRINKTSMEYKFIALNNSHQNMIRNWGGGIYQYDFFYDLCDEYGIMIWHDLMFASASYWIRPSFLKSVTKEILDQVRRIQYHPSITIWSGNNEDEFYGRCTDNPSAYSALTFGAALNNIGILDDTLPRMGSSPSNGNETEEYPCDLNNNTLYGGNNIWLGDNHNYSNKDCWNTSHYARARFESEFGVRSFPSATTMKEYIPYNQQYYYSDLMANRNQVNGNASNAGILHSVQFHYNIPSDYNNQSGFEKVLYLTQVHQAYCIKIEVEFYRSIRNNCSETLPGCNFGQMYWQTNDFWPGVSWSAIDWRNRYKMLQYYAQSFNYPIMLVGFLNYIDGSNQEIDNYEFWSIVDESAQIQNIGCNQCKLEIMSYSWSNGSISKYSMNIGELSTAEAKIVMVWSKNELLKNTGCNAATDCVIKWNLYNDQSEVINTNWMLLDSPKKSIAKDPKLNITNIIQTNDKEFEIWLNVENMAVFVWLETSVLGYFNDNGMLMPPGLQKNIRFYARSNETNVQVLESDLYVYSLYEAGGFKN